MPRRSAKKRAEASARMKRTADAGKKYYQRHVSAMLSYMGWFTCSDTYGCYLQRIKPFVEIKKLKHIISKIQRRKNHHDRMDQGILLQPA